MGDLVRSVNSDVAFSDAELASIIDNVWGAYGMFVTDKVGRCCSLTSSYSRWLAVLLPRGQQQAC
jgi:hypothetical protein